MLIEKHISDNLLSLLFFRLKHKNSHQKMTYST